MSKPSPRSNVPKRCKNLAGYAPKKKAPPGEPDRASRSMRKLCSGHCGAESCLGLGRTRHSKHTPAEGRVKEEAPGGVSPGLGSNIMSIRIRLPHPGESGADLITAVNDLVCEEAEGAD